MEREREVVSLLDRLRSPASSDLFRKRKLSVNMSGNHQSQSSVPRKANEPTKVSACQRVQEFKNESLIVSQNGALFCQSCREELSLKKQNIAVHMSSKKANKEKMEKNARKENHIANAIAKYDEVHHPKDETFPTSTRVFRVKVVQAFIKNGTPLSRVEYFRSL